LAVIAGGDAAEVFQAAEEAFDTITGFIKLFVIAILHLAIFLWWNDGLGAAFFDEVAHFIAVIAAICNYGLCRRRGSDTFFGRNIIADIAGRQNQNNRASFVICNRMNLAVAASARVAYAAIRAPFLRPLLAVR